MLLESFEIEKQILPTYKVTTFIATEGIYETYRFFSVDLASKDQETLEQKTINPLCGNNWEILKAAYPNEEESKLLHYCANGIYLTELLYNAYQLQNKQLKVAYKINQDNINWTRGVIFYELIAT